jgi:hypothetical protein
MGKEKLQIINKKEFVPEKTIAIFSNPIQNYVSSKNMSRVSNLIEKSPKKRDWFTPHFYKCLPLAIGNQYGFVIKSEFDFSFMWNGGEKREDVYFNFEKESNKKYPLIESRFGSGIVTINLPLWLRTPPGVNLMTINPPNFIIPNITVMTGVIETDNLRRNFTFNLKIQIPNIEVFIPAGTPIAAFIPIPRYYCDSFELKHAEDIFSEGVVDEEIQAYIDADTHRESVEKDLKGNVGKHYMIGKDVYGNKFSDHQKP